LDVSAASAGWLLGHADLLSSSNKLSDPVAKQKLSFILTAGTWISENSQFTLCKR